MGIEDVADELYGLAPEDFTAARNARAKVAKDDGEALRNAAHSLKSSSANVGRSVENSTLRPNSMAVDGL